ncbi:hypothetical protein BJ322DRAFT_144978 [Thelephora terrestris]|uniref:F-box domain-containing protein n=1 Tax=Thelephora terrestris TaxID=56493 RepID=A0A9P6L5A7_9AGAM|nr:hypothetical protein BJ322DRAFT_144978 [Thelephora terrestris]
MVIVIDMLRQMPSGCSSITHRLPPEILTKVAYHLVHDKSLVSATHVCRYWRYTLLSSPLLWSHIEYENEGRALAFLERSKPAPLSISFGRFSTTSEMFKESLMTITDRLIALRGGYTPFLDRFLTQPLPLLQDLDLFDSVTDRPKAKSTPTLPSVRSLAARDVDYCLLFHVPNLTNFRFELKHSSSEPAPLADDLFAFLRSCPLLEVVFLSCGNRGMDMKFTKGKEVTDAVSLPHLRSFTHTSPSEIIDIGLFDRLLLPRTCDVEFVVKTHMWTFPKYLRSWTDVFPTPRDPSYLSDVKMVKTTAVPQIQSTIAFKAEFLSSQNTRISFTRISHQSGYYLMRPSNSTPFIKLLDFIGSGEIADSIETLRFESYPVPLNRLTTPPDFTSELQKFGNLETLVLWQCDPLVFLKNPSPPRAWCPAIQKLVICLPPPGHPLDPTEMDILKLARDVAVSRRLYRTPLEAITVVSRDPEGLLRACEREMEELRNSVGSMEVVELND